MPRPRVHQRIVQFVVSRALSPEVPASHQLGPLQALADALYSLDLDWYAATPGAPSVLDRVRYVPDPRGTERWLDAGQLLMRGAGDCKSIAAAVAAEWTLAGRSARPLVVPVGLEEAPDFHVLVQTTDDGARYDPCITAGMPT
ncbi:MAG: hypothetical protein EBR82_81925 [Caulobacteraceae bacterium]|nr:hypothetical protein [Caulobacteraceae bacterium]